MQVKAIQMKKQIVALMTLFLAFTGACSWAAPPNYTLSIIGTGALDYERLRVNPDGVAYFADLSSPSWSVPFSDTNSKGELLLSNLVYRRVTDGLELLRTYPAFNAPYTQGYGINERGDVLLAAYSPQFAESYNFTIFPIDGTGPVAVPISSYRRTSLNDHWDIVGGGVSGGAFLYTDGQTYDLSSLVTDFPTGFNIVTPTGINNSRYIVGVGSYQGRQAAFLLTPERVVQGVSEPPPLALLLASGIAAALVRRLPTSLKTRRLDGRL